MSHESGDFLVISDPSWVPIPNATEVIQAWPGGEAEIMLFVNERAFTSMEPMLEDAGIMPLGYTIINANLVKAGIDDLRLWVQYAQLPPNPA